MILRKKYLMSNTIVLIPHFNNPEGLKNSIASIGENETVDVIVIDDGSTKNKIVESDILNSQKFKGSIFFIHNSENRGIEHVLNDGIDFALQRNYKYIARLDCGDLCHPLRFQKQISFLDTHPDISLLGTSVKAINTDGEFLYNIYVPEENKEIRKKMYLNAMFIHPTILFRSSVIQSAGKYPLHFKSAEDYAFFFQILKTHKGANLKETLVSIEINDSGISLQRRKQQVRSRIEIIKSNFYFGFWPIYGLGRSYILYLIPNSLVFKTKKLLYSKKNQNAE